MAVLDSHSFRINGYFEETKLPGLKVGDKVRNRLMSGGPELEGERIRSAARQFSVGPGLSIPGGCARSRPWARALIRR